MVYLVALLEPAQDRNRVLDGRLVDQHRLETALERGILFDVLAVFVQRRGADGVQFTARQHRLEHVAGVHGPFGSAGSDDGVQLVNKEDHLAGCVGDLFEDGLEPLLELATVLGASDEGTHIELHDALLLEPFGHVAAGDALGEPLGDGGLADTGLADQDRVILGPAAEDLDNAPDFAIAADDRVELALARQLGQVAPIALQRLVGGLGVLGGDALTAADAGERLQNLVAADAVPAEQVTGPAHLGQCQQDVLGADIFVLHPAGLILRLRQRVGGLLGQWGLGGTGLQPRPRGKRPFQLRG